MRSIGWGAGGSGLAGYCEPQDQALHGIAPRTAPSPRSGTPLPRRGGSCRRRPAENRARTWPHPCISRAAGRSAPALPENPLTFPPDWDTIVEQNRPDGASTVHTAGTERAPRLKAPTARRTGDGPTSGPGDGRGPLPATEGLRERPGRSEHGWHHESRRSRPVAGDGSAFLRREPASGAAGDHRSPLRTTRSAVPRPCRHPRRPAGRGIPAAPPTHATPGRRTARHLIIHFQFSIINSRK